MANPEWDNYKTPERRYSIQSDGDGHEYFVEVGMEGEFQAWVDAEYESSIEYEGYDYKKNRIDGRFTFTDPRCE
jgi:Fe-S cluster assembly iron-binding protein IscA